MAFFYILSFGLLGLSVPSLSGTLLPSLWPLGLGWVLVKVGSQSAKNNAQNSCLKKTNQQKKGIILIKSRKKEIHCVLEWALT